MRLKICGFQEEEKEGGGGRGMRRVTNAPTKAPTKAPTPFATLGPIYNTKAECKPGLLLLPPFFF